VGCRSATYIECLSSSSLQIGGGSDSWADYACKQSCVHSSSNETCSLLVLVFDNFSALSTGRLDAVRLAVNAAVPGTEHRLRGMNLWNAMMP
jgi:hypothetical protein